jgi:acetylornithine/N-succinyldiaminopimelate aminotransferase|tara:strand:- start:1264 stop:2448 length:1185 start_codon:yes stop_codon:yes gene_type:complete
MKSDFLKYQAQTTPHSLTFEVSHADGSYIYDTNGKKHLDFVAGVSANSLGHCHPKVSQAIQEQLKKYTHVMVYGEFIQKPQLELCKLLAQQLPKSLETVYLTNSGTEAVEGALKLAKRFTNRYEIISCKNSYHGNTQGSMSVSGVEKQNQVFRPLIPGVRFVNFNNIDEIQFITDKTACVIIETIQGGAGFIEPKNNYLHKVQRRCEEVGALLILDEIQTGIGRTGTFFGFENYNCIPDIIIAGKGLGGGMPIGAFISSNKIMRCLEDNPKLGHITTFGGHPLIAAAGLATVKEIVTSNLMNQALDKEELFKKLLIHDEILEIRGKGLMLSLIFKNGELASSVILKCLEKGLILFWLLFEVRAVRITPPLTISTEEIKEGCAILLDVINEVVIE